MRMGMGVGWDGMRCDGEGMGCDGEGMGGYCIDFHERRGAYSSYSPGRLVSRAALMMY